MWLPFVESRSIAWASWFPLCEEVFDDGVETDSRSSKSSPPGQQLRLSPCTWPGKRSEFPGRIARHFNNRQKPTVPEEYPVNLHPPIGFQVSTAHAGGRLGTPKMAIGSVSQPCLPRSRKASCAPTLALPKAWNMAGRTGLEEMFPRQRCGSARPF